MEYQKKKNELLQVKTTIQEKIKELETKGNSWLEPFSEFVNRAQEIGKIARAKKNGPDLAIGAKMVGSNFFLTDRQLAVKYASPGWDALAALPSAASASPFWSSTPNLRRVQESNLLTLASISFQD